jgi:DNA-binding transcriptional ArsR family regulator
VPEPTRADAFDALADVQRRTILSMLGAEPQSVQQLADELPISRPAVSRHLRVLSEAGLVREERVGTRHIFSLHEEGLTAVHAYLEQVWGDAAARFTLFAENTAPESKEPEKPGKR